MGTHDWKLKTDVTGILEMHHARQKIVWEFTLNQHECISRRQVEAQASLPMTIQNFVKPSEIMF
jgi:hypothetical protein